MGLLGVARSHAQHAALVRDLWGLGELLRLGRLAACRAVRRGSLPAPVAAAWYLTWACPERCGFCEVAAGQGGEALGTGDALRLVDRLVPWTRIVALAGGEPLAHVGLVPVVRRVGERGGRAFLATNGVLLDAERARDLAAARPAVVNVSVLGDEAVHDAMVGRPGAWRDAIDGIAALLRVRDARRTRVCINGTVCPENVAALGAVAELGRGLGVDRVRFTWLSFLTEAERAAEGGRATCLVLPSAALDGFDAEAMAQATAAVERGHPGFVSFHPHLDRRERVAWYREGGGVVRPCPALWHTLFLRPDGQAVPCGHLFGEPAGRVLDEAPELAWNAPGLAAVRADRGRPRTAICRRCCKV